MNWENMYDDFYAVRRIKSAVNLARPYIFDSDTVLDIGCFTQEIKKYLPDNITYVGIDSKAYTKEVNVVDIEVPTTFIKADIVFCLEVLEHLKNPKSTLSIIKNSIGSTGYSIISLPNEATIFHRIRCLFGIVDAECFSESGKHLHLPNLNQCRKFLNKFFVIHKEVYYINPSATGSRQAWLGKILQLIPDCVHQWLADIWPSLFARGFIFLLKSIPKISSISKKMP